MRLLRTILVASAVSTVAVSIVVAQERSSPPTLDDIVDALSPPPPPEERTRSFKTRGFSGVAPPQSAVSAAPVQIETNEITFESGSAELTKEAKDRLRAKYAPAIQVVAARARSMAIAAKQPVPAKQTLYVIGHTDDRGGDDYNMKLSKDRAKSVVDYLRVITGNEINVETVELLYDGCGKQSPKIARSGDVQENRRVVIKNAARDARICD